MTFHHLSRQRRAIALALSILISLMAMIHYLPFVYGHGPDSEHTHDEAQNEAAPAEFEGKLFDFSPVRSSIDMNVTLPNGFLIEEDFVSGVNGGVAFDWAPDGRMFIAQRTGVVRVFENDNLLSQPFIDISAQVNRVADRGMLGLAVHPDFPTEPYIYLLFTYDPPGLPGQTQPGDPTPPDAPDGDGERVSRLIRVTADANENYNVAEAGSELILLGSNSTLDNIGDPAITGDAINDPTPPPASCDNNGTPIEDCLPADENSHTIGSVRFAEDDNGNHVLFVSNGDGSSHRGVDERALRALDIDSLAGKILRIDPDTGEGLPDNPHYDGNPNSNRSKVYDAGLRNPFRITVNPDTNEPFIGDVGWATWEEVNTGAGVNFGWPCYEGGNGSEIEQPGYSNLAACQSFYANANVEPAIYAFEHPRDKNGSDLGAAVIMGDFATADPYPTEYEGVLFFGEFNFGTINYITFDGTGNVASVEEFATGFDRDSGSAIVQINIGPDGNLYLMNIFTGQIHRIVYDPARPTAQVSADPTDGGVPLTVNFSSDGSSDPNGDTLTYEWDFGDGNSSTEANPSHTYNTADVYDTVLTVRNSLNFSDTASISISVGNHRPVATIITPPEGFTYNVGDLISFSGSASDVEDGALTGNSLMWELILNHNNHAHPNEIPDATGESGTFIAPEHGDDNTALQLCLTATDSEGLSDQECVLINPNTVNYTFDTVPSGLSLTYAGVERVTPFTVDAIVNGQRTVNALPTQGNFEFSSWSDGGDASHLITIGNSDETIIATYTPQDSFSDSFTDFSNLSKIHLNGDAEGINDVLRLTPASTLQRGSAFYNAPFNITDNTSFSTRFEFRIHGSQNGADGMTFMIQGNDRTALGHVGGGFGYTSIPSSLAIEIDTFLGGSDPNANHIGLLTNGSSNHVSTYIPNFDLQDEQPHAMWVEYDGETNQLDVYLAEDASASQPASPVMSVSDVDLHNLLGDLAFFGFSAATGGSVNNHDVENWDLDINEPSTCGGLVQEAEDGVLSGYFEVGSDSAARNNQYIHVPNGMGNRWNGPDDAHKANYCFEVDKPGIYKLNGGIYAESGSDNSFFVKVDGSPINGNLWDFPKNTVYQMDEVSNRNGDNPVLFTLQAGEHNIELFLREDGARLDRLELEFVEPIPNMGSCDDLLVEAEEGEMTGAFVIGDDNTASGEQYVHVPNGAGNSFNMPNPDQQVEYCFNVQTAGTYRIKGGIYAESGSDNSFFVKVDNAPSNGYLWDFPKNTIYQQDYVSNRNGADPVEVVLSAGEHTVTIFLREDGGRLDNLELELVSSSAQTLDNASPPIARGVRGTLMVNDDQGQEELDLSGINLTLIDAATGGNDYNESTQTDHLGQYYFDEMPVGEYKLSLALPEGYSSNQPTEVEVTTNTDQMVEVSFDIQIAQNSAIKIFLPLVIK